MCHLQAAGESLAVIRFLCDKGVLWPIRWVIKRRRKCAICRLRRVISSHKVLLVTKVICCRCFIRTTTSPVLSSWPARYLSSRCALPSHLFIQYMKWKLFARNKDHTILSLELRSSTPPPLLANIDKASTAKIIIFFIHILASWCLQFIPSF